MSDSQQKKAWQQALKSKANARPVAMPSGKTQGIGPNKAAGRKGGIRRQGSKRG